VPIDNTQHGRYKTNGENIIRIGKETNTSDNTGANMVPAKRSLVDFGKSQTTSLIGIGNVSLKTVSDDRARG